jgi:protein SCO1
MKALIIFLSGLLACTGVGCYQQQPLPAGVIKNNALPFYNTADFTPHWRGDKDFNADTVHRIAAFSFTNQYGYPVTSDSVKGKIYVADFFFTACAGICPKLATHMKMVQDSFVNDKEVLLLSHSVTPEQDDVPTLKRYAATHGVSNGKWHLLTGDKEAIYTLARKSYFADEDLGMQRNTGDFLHTENMLLIDRQGRIRGLYKGTSPVEMQNLVADIRKLKGEQ